MVVVAGVFNVVDVVVVVVVAGTDVVVVVATVLVVVVVVGAVLVDVLVVVGLVVVIGKGVDDIFSDKLLTTSFIRMFCCKWLIYMIRQFATRI